MEFLFGSIGYDCSPYMATFRRGVFGYDFFSYFRNLWLWVFERVFSFYPEAYTDWV